MTLKRTLLAVSVVVLLLTLFAVTASAKTSAVVDDAGLFSAEETASIEEKAKAAGEKYGVRFFIITTEDYVEADKYNWGLRFINNNGLDENDNMIFLVISNRRGEIHYYMYYYGMPAKRISDDEVDEILDDYTVAGIKNANYAAAAERFIELAGKATRVNWFVIVFVALLVGGVAGGVTAGAIYGQYKKKLQSTIYPLDKYAKLTLKDKKDTFIGKHTATVIISSGSGGRSGGGGGGGHSGGFAGGR